MSYYYDLEQNSFPMRDWHVKHMEQTLVKFVTGLSDDASNWERRMNKKYGRITKVCKRIEYDIWYLENWSVWLDIKIIFSTLFLFFKNDQNAY